MSVTDEHRTTPRRREPARTGARRGARARPDAATRAGDPDRDDLRLPSDQVLPPGRRDDSGFWIPEGYEMPEALFSPNQRRLQEKQRQAHRARRQRDAEDGDTAPSGGPEDDGARVDSPDPSE